MTDRGARLAAARLADWRFLLPDPHLGRVGLVDPADPDLLAALEALGEDVVTAPASELAARDSLDVVVLDERGLTREPAVTDAVRALRPGGWVLVELPRRRLAGAASRTVERALRAAGAESIGRHWSLPNRSEARRIVPLGDRGALRAAMSMHGSRPARRIQAAVARQVAAVGGAELLGGEVTLLARRSGGAPASGWPALDSLEPMLAAAGLRHPSWLLLTPRFPASAHVVLLLLADGAPALVAKLARLPGDDGPEREGASLRAFAAAGGDPASAPELLHAGRIGDHSVLVERALDGTPLDRRRVRADPSRWVGAVADWAARMPVTGRLAPADHDALLQRPLASLRDGGGDPAIAPLVTATLDLLAPLRGAGLPLVFEHGDLGHPNLLEVADGRIGALDWELARADGLPLNDLVFFLGYVALALEGDAAEPFDAFVRVLADPRWRATDAIRAESRRLGIDPTLNVPLVAACWARAAAGLAHRLGDGAATGESRSISHHRYYSLWSRAVEHQGRLTTLLS